MNTNKSNNKKDIPILLITWRRPEHTLRSLYAALECKSKNIYVYNDGFSNNEEINKDIYKTRKLIIDYAKLYKNIIFKFNKNKSMGCKIGVTNAINWLFENNEFGIIIEDDILISDLFYKFCSHYINIDKEINLISSFNYDTIATDKKNNYRFSKHIYIWGWACSKNIWSKYKYSISEERIQNILRNSRKKSKGYKRYLRFIIKKCREINAGKLDTWDYQLSFLCLEKNLMCLVPNVPLSENIGFDLSATHTIGIKPSYIKGRSKSLILDDFIESKKIDIKADNKVEKKIYFPSIQFKIRNKLITWINRLI